MLGSLKTNLLVYALLKLMGMTFRLRPRFRSYLKGIDGWMNFSVGIRTRDDSVRQCIRFEEGRARVSRGIPDDVDTVLCFKNKELVGRMLEVTPEEVMDLMLKNELSMSGNLATMNKFNFFLSLILKDKHVRMRRERSQREAAEARASAVAEDGGQGERREPGAWRRADGRLKAEGSDAVRFLDDPYLSNYSLDDFPRLKGFLDIHLTRKPSICHERAMLMTDWFRNHGFEHNADGEVWVPELRQAGAFKHLMEKRKPIIRKNDLIAGTTTAREIGVVLYPDTHATTIWGELFSVPDRDLNPYHISEECRDILHFDIFPYWEKRNIREWVRQKHDEPLCQQLDERFAVYFNWKTVALSHTIADFPKLLKLGTSGMKKEIREEMDRSTDQETDKQNLLQAMIMTLEGIEAYAANLSLKATEEAEAEADAGRKEELETLSEICARVPRQPAESLHEALNAIWIGWVALHMENTNAGLSLGRMDQWLQPYFESEMDLLKDLEDRRSYIERALELVGCFYMRCTDHLPLVPDIGNFLFGGSSSDQAITLGGITPEGENAVNDMTFIFLKVTEMLGIRDPNVNARYNREVNSESYFRRLCEVNLITTATPSMHNDQAVMQSLEEFAYPEEHLRDWSAVGCVEPTISGRHMGHTGSIMMNMVAALEMALNNGRHPLMDWKVGPETGEIGDGAFSSFEEFFEAFAGQYRFLIDRACEYNNLLAEAHRHVRPTPFLSSLIDGSRQSGLDVTAGGATYNSTGVACIGLADVSDSLMAIKRLVYDEEKIGLTELRKALEDNFESDEVLHARILKDAPKFGSGDPDALAMAERVASFTHDCLADHTNYRGGKYTAGFWSMSNHVAFGCLSGALPSGRVAGKAFTPGLTPHPLASDNLLDPIRDVAGLDPRNMPNNIAFNVKIVPDASESHMQAVDNILSYVKTYFDLGGMQMQFNVVTSAVLKEAMIHPENYRNLLVRITGYNAYFTTLNRDMQLELIERAEYGV